MSRIFLTDDARVLETLIKAQLPAFKPTSEQMPDLRNADEIVVIGKSAEAKKGAMALVARGVPDFRLSYAETDSASSVRELIQNPKHLHWDDAGPLAEAPEEKDFPTYPSGYPFLDPNLKWRIPELDVFAGPYGSGKSLLAQLLAFRFTATIDRQNVCGALLCSWEDEPAELRRNLALHARSHGDDPVDLVNRVHYVRRHPDDDRLIAWYTDLVRYYNARYGTRFFALDPWNEIDHVKDSRQSETDYVRDMMKEFRRLVNKLGIILIVVTHVPAKMIRGNGEIEPFRLAQAFGSVNFANKADRGICVLRTKSLGGEHMILRFDKSKIERKMGRKGTIALVFDDDTHTLRYDSEATAKVRDLWKD